jgi:Ca2+-transporting ATPase
MQTLLSKQWHHLPAAEVQTLLSVDVDQGLDLFDIQNRQKRFGPNALTPREGQSPLLRFLLQFNDPLIYVLLVSSVVTGIVKGLVDAAIILGVVLINAIVGFIQEARAEQAITALAQTMTSEATVLRAGRKQRLPATELVPGDVVLLQAGDKVPADIRLVKMRELQVIEASLTGESVPVAKDADVVLPADTTLGDRHTMAYASTLVTYGQGTGIVVATGDNTQIGRISALIAEAKEIETPLIRKIGEFSNVLLYALLGVSALAFFIGLIRGLPLAETLTNSIALAVASIPEGLPAAVTVTLAIGVSRMARRCAIIRKLPAVEALGSTTVIGSDKTGTLTRNQMTVQKIVAGDVTYRVDGVGYAPEGQIWRGDEALASENMPVALRRLLEAGALCNDSQVMLEDGTWTLQGDPTEAALLVAARKAGIEPMTLTAEKPRLDSVPFESEHQYMITLHDEGAGQPRRLVIKGAAEAVLTCTAHALGADGTHVPFDREAVLDTVNEMAAQGLRVLAFAERQMSEGAGRVDRGDAVKLTFLGLQGMIDPPRPEAMAAVRAAQEAGIKIKMITGDHPVTAAAVARQIGISCPEDAMTGRELAELSDTELIAATERVAVFARVTPEQKLRLVEALQAQGNVVAMTGDGVNDAPALKQADIGVAMGINGTDVAKEAADMVLTDDNFATIEAAVEEGRGVFDNLTKIITWTLPTNLGEGLVILAALLLGEVLPILPVQILWINMTTVAVLGLTLALEPKEPGIMRRPPRAPDAPILTGALIRRVALVGALILVGAFGLFEWEQRISGMGVDVARTVAVNLVIFVELFYLFNSRSLERSPVKIGLFSNHWVWLGVAATILLQAIFTYAPFMHTIFETAPLSPAAWVRIILFGGFSYVVVEIEKALANRRYQKDLDTASSAV